MHLPRYIVRHFSAWGGDPQGPSTARVNRPSRGASAPARKWRHLGRESPCVYERACRSKTLYLRKRSAFRRRLPKPPYRCNAQTHQTMRYMCQSRPNMTRQQSK